MKLTLRDLFWLVLVVGMGCAWWLDHRTLWLEVERLKPYYQPDDVQYFPDAKEIDFGTAKTYPSSPAENIDAPTDEITKERAVDIVRALIIKESPDAIFDCEASESPEGFRVFVTFGSERDASGRISMTFPGGHALYKLSKTGKVLHVIGGA